MIWRPYAFPGLLHAFSTVHCSRHFECCFGPKCFRWCLWCQGTQGQRFVPSPTCVLVPVPAKPPLSDHSTNEQNRASSMQSSTSAHTLAPTTFVHFSENNLSTPSSGWKTYLPRNFCPSHTITSAFSLSYLLSCSIYTSFQLLLLPPVIKSHSAQTFLAQANILNLNVGTRRRMVSKIPMWLEGTPGRVLVREHHGRQSVLNAMRVCPIHCQCSRMHRKDPHHPGAEILAWSAGNSTCPNWTASVSSYRTKHQETWTSILWRWFDVTSHYLTHAHRRSRYASKASIRN